MSYDVSEQAADDASGWTAPTGPRHRYDPSRAGGPSGAFPAPPPSIAAELRPAPGWNAGTSGQPPAAAPAPSWGAPGAQTSEWLSPTRPVAPVPAAAPPAPPLPGTVQHTPEWVQAPNGEWVRAEPVGDWAATASGEWSSVKRRESVGVPSAPAGPAPGGFPSGGSVPAGGGVPAGRGAAAGFLPGGAPAAGGSAGDVPAGDVPRAGSPGGGFSAGTGATAGFADAGRHGAGFDAAGVPGAGFDPAGVPGAGFDPAGVPGSGSPGSGLPGSAGPAGGFGPAAGAPAGVPGGAPEARYPGDRPAGAPWGSQPGYGIPAQPGPAGPPPAQPGYGRPDYPPAGGVPSGDPGPRSDTGPFSAPAQADPVYRSHDPAAADLRSQVVRRIRFMNFRHAEHAWERRYRDPIGPHALAFLYAEPPRGKPPRYTLKTATRLFLAGPEVDDLPQLLADLTDVVTRAPRGQLDCRTLADRAEDMTAGSTYIGLAVSSLDTPAGPWAELRNRVAGSIDVPGRCFSYLDDGTMLLMDRGGQSRFGHFEVRSTDSLDEVPGDSLQRWTYDRSLAEYADPDTYDIWVRLRGLHESIVAGGHR
jgi:uncharacterized protein YndB with AHSA1/START domain